MKNRKNIGLRIKECRKLEYRDIENDIEDTPVENSLSRKVWASNNISDFVFQLKMKEDIQGPELDPHVCFAQHALCFETHKI